MANASVIGLHSGEKPLYLVTSAIMSGSDAEIDAALAEAGYAAPKGTVIATAGFETMKMKGLDGAYAEVG